MGFVREMSKHDDKGEERKEEKKRTNSGRRGKKPMIQMYLGLSGGAILLAVGATGSIGFYDKVINYAVAHGVVSRAYGTLIIVALIYLAASGGITVIAGSILIPKIRQFGVLLVRIGAGISLTSIVTRVFMLGPIIQEYISMAYSNSGYLLDAVRLISVDISLVGVGVMLSFMATFRDYRWTLTISAMAICSMFVGVSSNPRIFEYINCVLGIAVDYRVYMDYTVKFMLYIGALLLVAAVLAGIGHVWLSKVIVFVCMIATLFPLVSIVLDLQQVRGYLDMLAIIQYMRCASVAYIYAGGIYFIKKAK